MNPTVEILAPAGSFETMVGAVNAGADAVYMGGQMFGARAYADNPDERLLMEAIDFVHIHGKKLYLTVNTLMKDKELEQMLYNYLRPLYIHGLDAVIVQDMGALTAIRQWFPDMDIHASTQMTVVSKEHARSLKALGVTRIVPARELSLGEIHQLKEEFGGEIECFVHGALCYCYSGQCLLSSMLGGRSGNRGRCAQPCRLPYRLMENGRITGKAGEAYMLSPKDICTLDLIPELVECGIDSFKIEGRMKKAEYAAFVSHIYRKYTDAYLKYGKDKYHVDPADRQALMDLYNRGGFSEGYYKNHNGRAMMSLSRPNHWGSCVGKVSQKKNGMAVISAAVPLFASDVLLAEGMEDKDCVTIKEGCREGGKISVRFPGNISVGTPVYRLRSASLLQQIRDSFLDIRFTPDGSIAANNKNQENIYVSLTFLKELPAKMHLTWRDISVDVTGAVVEAAKNQPMTEEMICERMKKTGNTPFAVNLTEVQMDEDIYIPVQMLNQLRRDGVEALKNRILQRYRRDSAGSSVLQTEDSPGICEKRMETVPAREYTPQKRALISDLSMVDAVLEANADGAAVTCIYLEPWLLKEPALLETMRKIHRSGCRCAAAMPYIFREAGRQQWEQYVTRRPELFEKAEGFDGYLIRNVESLEFLKDFGLMRPGENTVFDYNLYGMNRRAVHYYKSMGASQTTLPMELNYHEQKMLGAEGAEMVVYGHIPLMVSAQCLRKTTAGCKKNAGMLQLKDRYGKVFCVRTVCDDCYNLIYNSQPLVLFDLQEEQKNIGPASLRYIFTNESPEMIRAILKTDPNQSGETSISDAVRQMMRGNFTRGHFNRGVE